MQWFEVDRKGLGKLLERRGFGFVLFELVQNALDTAAKVITVDFHKVPRSPYATISVEDDDPTGFKRLTDAWTLFAESDKKVDPTLRGRWNLGEKLVLALCKTARIESTTGTVVFDEKGRHRNRCAPRTAGSRFYGELRCSQEDYEAACEDFKALIVPKGVDLRFNGDTLSWREPVTTFKAPLVTLIANSEGALMKTTRQALVDVYEPRSGEVGTLYELGIPVMETQDKFHYDVRQKIPLGFERDNVPPVYLADLRAHVLNETAELLDKEEATHEWVSEALGRKNVEPDAVDRVLDLRFGKKHAIWDPTDKEANNRLIAEGYTVIHGRTFSRAVWENIRLGKTKPSGKISPTPKPYSNDPNAPEVHVLSDEEMTQEMREFRDWAEHVSYLGIDMLVRIRLVNTTNNFAACFGHGCPLDINVRKTKNLFQNWSHHKMAWLQLLIHELAHYYADNHLSDDYHQACCKVGARLALCKEKL